MRPKATAENAPAAAVAGGPSIALGLVAGEVALATGLDTSLALAIASATTAVIGYAIRRFGLPNA